MRWTSSLRWSNGGTYDTAECCHLHFEDQAGCPRREDSLGHVLLHVQTAVLRALVWNGGPGYCCQEPSCCCDGLSSFGPLTGPVFISLCDLKWPCTVRWNVAPDSVLLPWEHGPKAGVGFSPHAGIPIPQGRRSLKRLGALPQEPCHHPPPPPIATLLPLLAGSYSYLHGSGQSHGPQRAWAQKKELVCFLPWAAASWSVCLSLAVAGCVLWTSRQDVALSLLETELGLRAA